ncbi:lipase member H-like [Cydia strobilella]|uniref:lipase member H-like n=1 Tax=Cydia strobilella TaxID=1100964 RepID=UPI0030045574
MVNFKSIMLSTFISVFIILTILASISGDWVFNSILNHSVTCDHNKTLNRDVSRVQVYFYDFKNNYNNSYPIDTAAEELTKSYNLDVTRKLVFFVPGFKSNITRKTEELIRQTFKDVQDTYLIIIDHSPYTSLVHGKSDSYSYGRAVSHVYYIGKALGKFLTALRAKGFPSSKIHCIGHSLGSQILGNAGYEFNMLTKEKVWRITGIDPAGPCFSNSFIEEQIRSGLSEYVEVYHCNAGGLGTTSVLADADFFLNKGYKQPDCNEGLLPVKGDSDQAKCSHKACVTLWAKTVHHPGAYLAWACDSYKSFSKGKCAGNEVTIAGYSNPGNATGVFYASTDGYGI